MKNLCKDCQEFVNKYKQWDENKVPQLAEVSVANCRKYRMSYTVYNGMVFPSQLVLRR
ncbi:MAG: hypothetical protein HZB65_01855 [Candidatus Aenigmarchaeota archaeon]|nr:hypothetical protein [Candidatus Aenigmarchaeota archaeon]